MKNNKNIVDPQADISFAGKIQEYSLFLTFTCNQF